MAIADDVVFLIPGFLGFERFREFAYFGDRVSTALRVALSREVGRTVPVVAVPIPPASSLSERQHALGRTLVARTKAIAAAGSGNVSRVHLIGHSTGGVDAELLTKEFPLSASSWSDVDGADLTYLRSRLRSVISIGSPHQGACIAASPLGQLVGSENVFELLSRSPSALQDGGRAFIDAVHGFRTLIADPDLLALSQGLFGGSSSTLRFMRDLTRSRALIEDLDPERAAGRYARLGSSLPLLRRSFVTVAGVTPSCTQSATDRAKFLPSLHEERRDPFEDLPSRTPDPLYLLLTELASGRRLEGGPEAHLLPGSVERLRTAQADPSRILGFSPKLLPPTLDAAMNDGVVNSARQLIDPQDPDELASIVIADHFDVVGHYDRAAWVTDPKTGDVVREEPEIAGLLHSGSRFRDDQFFDLMLKVAEVLTPALT